MARTPIYTPNILESMIEYTPISSILDRICEMTTKPWEHLRDYIQLLPMNMGNKMEKDNWKNRWMGAVVMDECEDI